MWCNHSNADNKTVHHWQSIKNCWMHWSFFTGFSMVSELSLNLLPWANTDSAVLQLLSVIWENYTGMSTAINTWESEDENTKNILSITESNVMATKYFRPTFYYFLEFVLNTVQLCFPLSEVSLRKKKIQSISLHLINFQIAKFYTVFAVLDEVLKTHFSSIFQLNH